MENTLYFSCLLQLLSVLRPKLHDPEPSFFTLSNSQLFSLVKFLKSHLILFDLFWNFFISVLMFFNCYIPYWKLLQLNPATEYRGAASRFADNVLVHVLVSNCRHFQVPSSMINTSFHRSVTYGPSFHLCMLADSRFI